MQIAPEKLAYTVPEAAKAIGVGRTTMWKEVRNGTLPSFKWGGRVLIRREDLQASINQAAMRSGSAARLGG
jgi:excisionase family DNA binding protein